MTGEGGEVTGEETVLAGGDIVIRPYRPSDRERVRHICYVTGYMGDPVDWAWRDQESFSDMFSLYYTDREPESALVAELDGEVAGYLLGCVDARRAWNPGAIAGRHIVRRGIALRPGTAGMVWRGFVDGFNDWRHHELPPMSSYDPRWPAHLHIDLLPEIRGRGAGTALVRRWLDSLRARGIPGCYLETMAENANAVAFFETVGFEKHGRLHKAPGIRSPEGERRHTLLMVQRLGPVPAGDGYVEDVSERNKLLKPAVGVLGLVGTMASIWWFALRPRRKRRKAG